MELTEFGGGRLIYGCNGMVQGALDVEGARERAIARAKDAGFAFIDAERSVEFADSRRTYADLYGPTTGDRIRLADTELVIEVEKDFTHYGDEITFGGGKVIRDGMGQSSGALREGAGRRWTW